jgi:hypothetical protein
LSFQPKFLGLVVQMAKRFNGRSVNEGASFSKSAEKWIDDVNSSVKKFQQFAMARNMAISQEEFLKIFSNSEPFIIEKCCDFTLQLRSIAEKAGVPVVHLTQDLCNKYKDSKSAVDVTKENGQYAISLNSIKDSYSNIANNLMRLA